MDHIQRQSALMQDRKINLVFDIGANTGQYGDFLRQKVGYKGRIVSFEPLRDAFAGLKETVGSDPLWRCENFALGDKNESATINISANSYSSSLLQASKRTLEIEPAIGYVGTQKVSVRRLDEIFGKYARSGDRVYLKIDTQGYELNVLNGALAILDRIELIQLETAFFETYHGATLVGDMIRFLDDIGYRVVSVEPGWENPKTGELLEADFIFGRK